jgi:hypothetical protein
MFGEGYGKIQVIARRRPGRSTRTKPRRRAGSKYEGTLDERRPRHKAVNILIDLGRCRTIEIIPDVVSGKRRSENYKPSDCSRTRYIKQNVFRPID